MTKKAVLLSFLILGISQSLGKASDSFAGLTDPDQRQEFLRKSCSQVKTNLFKVNLPQEQAGPWAADFVRIFKVSRVKTSTELEILKKPFHFIFWNQSQENLKCVFKPTFESLTEIFGDGSPYLQDMFCNVCSLISLAPEQLAFVHFPEECLNYRRLKAIHVEVSGSPSLSPYNGFFLLETNTLNTSNTASLFLAKYEGFQKQVSSIFFNGQSSNCIIKKESHPLDIF